MRSRRITQIYRNFNFRQNMKFSTVEVPTVAPTDKEWGNLIEVRNEGGSWHKYLDRMHKQLGPVFYFWSKDTRVVSIGNPKYWNALSHLTERPDSLRGFMKELTGKKAINFVNEEKKRQNYGIYINSTFSKEVIAEKQTKVLNRHFTEHIGKWDKYAVTGEKFPMLNRFEALTGAIMVEILFGFTEYHDEEELIKVSQYIMEGFAELEVKSFGGDYGVEKEKILQDKINFVKSTIRKWVEMWEKKPKTEEKTCFMDFLQIEEDAEARFSNLVNFVIASAPTLAKVQAYVTYALAKNPDKQRKMQKELDEYIPNNTTVTTDNLRGLKYLRACIKETLRLYSSSTTIARVDTKNDTDIGDGIIIPKNTPIILPVLHVFHSEELWQNPMDFYPERFKEHGIKYSLQYQPFGFAGGRVCSGKVLTDYMLQLFTAGIFKKYTVSLDEEDKEVKLRILSAIIPEKEMYVKFKSRQ